jgi:hypothetical protein
MAAVVAAAALAPAGRAGDPADDAAGPVIAAARAAIDGGRITQSKLVGFNNKTEFTEEPADGRVLVGLDIGLGKFFDAEMIWAYRAVYLTDHGEEVGKDHGLFHDKYQDAKKIVKSKVVRTVHLRAKPGYAVGGVTLHNGLILNGLSLTYMRMSGGALDPQQAYVSEWVGDKAGGGESVLSGGGGPVVGLFGGEEQERASGLGVYFADPPPAAPPVVRPPAEAHAPPPVERPVPPPPEEKPASQTGVPRWADPVAAPRPADEPPPAAAPESSPQAAAAAPAAPAKEAGPGLLPYIVSAAAFLAVSGIVAVVAFSYLGRKAPAPVERRPVRPERRPAVAASAPPLASALFERPYRPAPRPSADDVLELKESDFEAFPEVEVVEPAEAPKASPAADGDWPRLEI